MNKIKILKDKFMDDSTIETFFHTIKQGTKNEYMHFIRHIPKNYKLRNSELDYTVYDEDIFNRKNIGYYYYNQLLKLCDPNIIVVCRIIFYEINKFLKVFVFGKNIFLVEFMEFMEFDNVSNELIKYYDDVFDVYNKHLLCIWYKKYAPTLFKCGLSYQNIKKICLLVQ